MNKFFSAVALTTALMFSLSANAQFQAPAQAPVTVEQAKSLPDDTFVVLEGNITQQLGDEKYMFQDPSGTIVVEIDDEVRNANYIYRYGDRRATFERKTRLKELFEVVKSFAQVPEVEEKIDWLECFKFALEQYGIENANNFLLEDKVP